MKIKKYNRGIIRPTANGRYQAEVNHNYKRYRKTLPNEAQARTWIDATVVELENQNRPLTPFELREAREAFALLPQNVSLLEVAKYYIHNRAPNSIEITLSEATKQFLAEKKIAGLREKSLDVLRYQVNRLKADIGDKQVSIITASELLDWLENKKVHGLTRDGYRRAFHNLFNWCIRMGYRSDNPASALSPSLVDESLPGILTIAQATKYMSAAEKIAPELCAFEAIGFFAGIRAAEIARLQWAAINSDYIHIGPNVAKTRQQRYVAVSSNLRDWLKQYKSIGPVSPVRFKARLRRRKAIREEIKLNQWPHNAIRHSYATYHLAFYQDAPRTAHELGQTSVDMLYRHYRNLATKQEARKYFRIRPDSSNNRHRRM